MKKNQRGFTTIELLVVISIIVVFPTIIISNFPDIKLQFALSRVTYDFAQHLRNVQDMALSAVEYQDSFGVLQPVGGYGIWLDTNALGNKKYVIYADKEPANHQYDSLDYVIETTNFSVSEPGVIIKEIRNAAGRKASIHFHPPRPDTTITELMGSQQSIEIIFALESEVTKTRSVLVNTAGLIEIK